MKTERLLFATILLLMANHASAHHNWSALYDVESDMEIGGQRRGCDRPVQQGNA